jgi:hypothetical protein
LHDKNSPERVRPVVSGVAAAVDISPTNKSIHTPIQLRIELGKPYKTYLYNNRPLRNIFCWDLDINTIPWGESSNLPSPKSIWHLALDRTITPADPLLSDIKKCLEGITSEKQNSQ